MIKEIRIENYKSISKLKLEIGQVNVLIGENGCGKSNILEAIALSSAAANSKLDNEFLVSRGIRVTEPQFMRSAFAKENLDQKIIVSFVGNDKNSFQCTLQNDNKPYSKWNGRLTVSGNNIIEYLKEHREIESEYITKTPEGIMMRDGFFSEFLSMSIKDFHLTEFLIFCPDNSSLRSFSQEGQVQPLSSKGEGLFKLLKVLKTENKESLIEIKDKLHLIEWFKDFEIPSDLFVGENSIRIKDRFLDESIAYFDQNSSNEGFLFLLFYFALFVSSETPKFFAIDNIDESLNPKLCTRLIKELTKLAIKYNKQVIFTTHNPAVLDGLNLDSDEQRLFVVYRNRIGHTKARRILKPQVPESQEPIKLSEAFLRGYIGGLPKGL